MNRKLVVLLGSLCLALIIAALPFISSCASPAPSPSPSPTASPSPSPTASPSPKPSPSPTGSPSPSPSPSPKPTGQVYEFRLTHHDSITGPGHAAVTAWVKKVLDATGGRVKITVYPASTLAPATEAYNATVSGVADMAWGFVGFYPNRFPLTDILALPALGVQSSVAGSLALWNNYNKFPEVKAEYKDVKVLLLHTHQGAPIATRKVAVKTLDNLKGLKIRSPAGGPLDFLKAANSVPIMMPPADIYTSMEKGVIDGWTIDLIGASGFKLGEVTDWYTKPYYYVGTFWLVMNMSQWNSLPADLQKIVEGLSYDAGIKNTFAPFWDAGDQDAITKMGIKDSQFINLTTDEWAKWVTLGQGVWKTYIAGLTAKGLPAQAILDETQSFLKNYKP